MKILSTGSYTPPFVLDNEALTHMVETNDEWITTRTGIQRRHIAKGENTSHMAVKAARKALESCSLPPEELGFILVTTFTPDSATPPTACVVQKEMGLPQQMLTFDMNGACSGFVYGLTVANALLSTLSAKAGLVIGAELISRVTDYTDRGTCILFGDGAGAVVVGADDRPFYSSYGVRGNTEVLKAFVPNQWETPQSPYLQMQGQEVFRFAVEALPLCIQDVLTKAELSIDQVDYFICHQANHRILRTAIRRLGAEADRFYENLQEYGNTSSASIPLALDEMNQKGLLHPGMKLVLAGFGGGLTWGANLLEW